jgi:WD40 repeat protein
MRLSSSGIPEEVIQLGADHQAFAVPNRDGSLVALGSTHEDVAVMDSAGRLLCHIEESTGALSLAFSPDSTLLAVCSGNYGQRPENEIRIHDPHTGKLLTRLTNHIDRVWSLDFSPDGRLLASASSDQTIRIWNVAAWREIQRLRGHGSEVWTMAFSPDGKRLGSGSKDKTVRIWNVEGASVAEGIEGAAVRYGANPRAAFLNRETLFAALTSGGSAIGIWSVVNGKLLQTLPTESFCLGENEDRTAILTANAEQPLFVRSWDLQTFKLLREVALPGDTVFNSFPRLSQDRRTLVINQSEKATEIDCATGRIRRTISPPKRFLRLVEVSPDRRAWVVSSQGSCECALLSGTGPDRVSWLQGHLDGVYDLRFSPTQQILATVSIDNTARLWEWPDGRELAVLDGHKAGLFQCDFSPDGRILATASGDRTVKLWHVATRREMLTLRHEMPVTMCAFSPDGNYLASGTIDGAFRFWRAATWEEIGAKEKSSTEEP